MYKLYLTILLIFLTGCLSKCPPSEVDTYGEPYAEIDCNWVDPDQNERAAIWRCYEELETELLSGFVYLELESVRSLYLCGTDIVLNSGVPTYDNIIKILTEGRYNCLHLTEDQNLGNSFDWTWDPAGNVLQFIWRPDEEPDKVLTLVLEEAEYNDIVRNTIYYRILGEE